MKIWHIVKDIFGLAINNASQERQIGTPTLLLAEIALFFRKACTLCLGSATLKDNLKDDQHPYVDSPFIITKVATGFVRVELHDFANRFVQIDDT